MYDQPADFPGKHQLQSILHTRATLFIRTTKRMARTVRLQCATLPWSVFLPTYEFKISRFVMPSQMLHALVFNNAPGQPIDPVMSLALFFNGITLPSALLHQMVPMQYTFTASPEAILKLQNSFGHSLVKYLLLPVSGYMVTRGSSVSPPSFHLNIVDRPVRHVINSGSEQVETARFLLTDDEVNRAVSLGNNLLGGLKEVLTIDQGEQLSKTSAPLGAIVRDDMIPRLTPQDLLFVLSVSFWITLQSATCIKVLILCRKIFYYIAPATLYARRTQAGTVSILEPQTRWGIIYLLSVVVYIIIIFDTS